MPGNKEKANLKLQIRNVEAEFMALIELSEDFYNQADEVFKKLQYLKNKLAALEKKTGKTKAKK